MNRYAPRMATSHSRKWTNLSGDGEELWCLQGAPSDRLRQQARIPCSKQAKPLVAEYFLLVRKTVSNRKGEWPQVQTSIFTSNRYRYGFPVMFQEVPNLLSSQSNPLHLQCRSSCAVVLRWTWGYFIFRTMASLRECLQCRDETKQFQSLAQIRKDRS